jgi:hypothetical protein
MMKKVTAWLLTILMSVSLIPVTPVYAEGEPFITSAKIVNQRYAGNTYKYLHLRFNEEIDINGIPEVTTCFDSGHFLLDATDPNLPSADSMYYWDDDNYGIKWRIASHDFGSSTSVTLNDLAIVEDDPVNYPGICTNLTDYFSNYLLTTSGILVADGQGPEVSSIERVESTNESGVQAGDKVVVTFGEPTNQPAINSTNIDSLLPLIENVPDPVEPLITNPESRTWLDGSGAIGGAAWTSDTVLEITLGGSNGVPDFIGDFEVDSSGVGYGPQTITDSIGNLAIPDADIAGEFTYAGDITPPMLQAAYFLSDNQMLLEYNEELSSFDESKVTNYGTEEYTINTQEPTIVGSTVSILTTRDDTSTSWADFIDLLPGAAIDMSENASVENLVDFPVYDDISPEVLGLTTGLADGSYTVDEIIDLSVVYSEEITVDTNSGTPTLALNNGANGVYTGFIGNTVNFSYTVQNGEGVELLSNIDENAYNLNGAQVWDAPTIGGDLPNGGLLTTLPDAMQFQGSHLIRIDTAAPTLSNVVVTHLSTDKVMLTWDTDERADYTIMYQVTDDLITPPEMIMTTTKASRQSVVLTGLMPGTSYDYTIGATDVVGYSSAPYVGDVVTKDRYEYVKLSSLTSFSGSGYVIGQTLKPNLTLQNTNSEPITIEGVKIEMRGGTVALDIQDLSEQTIDAGGTLSFSSLANKTKAITGYGTYISTVKFLYNDTWYTVSNDAHRTLKIYPFSNKYLKIYSYMYLNPSKVKRGYSTRASFKIYNTTSATFNIQGIKAYLPNHNIFVGLSSKTIAGKKTYYYAQYAKATKRGKFAAYCYYKINGKWYRAYGDVTKYLTVY